MSTRKRLGLLLWGAGMTGVVSVSVLVLPMLLLYGLSILAAKGVERRQG